MTGWAKALGPGQVTMVLRSLRFVATLRVPFGLPAAGCLRFGSVKNS
jgi:hypothetical protein